MTGMQCIDTYLGHLKIALHSQMYRIRKWEFNVPTALYISTLQMHVFSTKLLFKFIQLYKFASENSSDNCLIIFRYFLYILFLMQRAHAYDNVKVM